MDSKKIWKDALESIKISISPATFSTWFSQTFISSLKGVGSSRNNVEVACPSAFIADTLEKRYFGLVQDSLNSVTGKKNDVTFLVKQAVSIGQKSREDAPLFNQQRTPQEETLSLLHRARIREGFTFENFAVSSTNQMAWAAADAVAKNPGKAYNPLFFWGGVGVGKTHLMLAIGSRVLKENPEARVLYCMGEEFTTEIIDAIRRHTTVAFKKRYRGLDLLLLDDVHFLAGKMAVQEEFFHTFNALQREGGQVVLTSDKHLAEIDMLEERLRSRFEAGLTIDISPPDFELRTAVSLIKAKERGMELPMDVAQTIAANINSNRRIEGFITRLLTETSSGQTLSIERVTQLLGKTDGAAQNNKRAVQPQDVISLVSSYFSVGKRQLLGPNRSRPVALPRQILMYLLRVELNLPLQEVGRVVGGRDHTTVMHAVEKISTNLSTDQGLRQDVLGIKTGFS